MPRKRSTFPNRITYVTNADLAQTVERLTASKLVLTGPENTKRGYEFRLKRFQGSMIQLTPTRKLNIWFRDFPYLENELQTIMKILVPKRGQELRMTLSRKDVKSFLHNLRGIFWALYSSELQSTIKSADKKVKEYLPGSLESQLAIIMPPFETVDRILDQIQTAMNAAWNRGRPNAFFFLKPSAFPIRDLIAEAMWGKTHGYYLTPTDTKVLTMSKTCTLSELNEHNRLKLEETKELSTQEILALEKKMLQDRLDWRRTNQPWRMAIPTDAATFIPFE